ncbi:MBL fold metallo-hydrolase [Zhongshania sp.]|uniref:MBL fold metallo-hydrolase n=1 Tax=Zhongshania sp. TaxID=1971902 RepID=UPI00356517CF
METQVTEIARDTFRISTFHPQFGIQFNQFLIHDEQPLLIHTGFQNMLDDTLSGISEVMDPAQLRWIGFSHFEADECGALNALLGLAPNAQAVCSQVAAMVNLSDFACREARGLDDGEILNTGRHQIRFLACPHVPHGWDAGLFFDETAKTLFCSDLFFHGGDPEPLTRDDISTRAEVAMREGLLGPLAHDMPFTPYTVATLQRLANLEPRTLATMHGSSFQGDGKQAILALASVVTNLLS